MRVDCKYKEKCSGCQYLDYSLAEQHDLKKSHLTALLKLHHIPWSGSIELVSPAAAGLRDRVDLVYDRGALGLYEKNTRQVLDIALCPQLSPPLQAWLDQIRVISWPVQKGSLRLRVSPRGERGLWLDFANVDIKALLEERTLLEGLLNQEVVIEMGQRHKVVVREKGLLKLRDPEPRPWFQSQLGGEKVDLYCSIGNFTQTGVEANQALTQIIDHWLTKIEAHHVLEFGSGIGNLSFPALGRERKLTACEIDRGALAGFEKSVDILAQRPGFTDLRERLQILQGDFQNRHPQNFGRYDTVLVNPPRSGLKEFLAPLLSESLKPKYFLYMSCFPESFAQDGLRLQAAGYDIHSLKIVDQFPQTSHYEILSLWTLR